MNMENKTENKIYKATIDCGDGRVNEIEGAGIIAIALTQDADGGVYVKANIEGMHSVDTLVAAINCMWEEFRETWDKANLVASLDQIFGRLFDNAEQTKEPTEEPTEAPTKEG